MMTNTGRSIAAAEGQKGAKIVRWSRKGLLWSVATLLALAVAGAAYQIVVTVIDQRGRGDDGLQSQGGTVRAGGADLAGGAHPPLVRQYPARGRRFDGQ